MNPPVFSILNASAAVKAVFGSSPLRVFPWGAAPENTARPYATYIVFNGAPENTMDKTPEIDMLGTQINIWADTSTSCQSASELIRNALEPYAHMTSFSSSPPDEDSEFFGQRLDFDFYKGR